MIDLHMHTNYSDGTDNLNELLHKAEAKKLEVISITDHDQIRAYQEISENPNIRKIFSGIIIPGAELKTVYKSYAIEVLAYGIDYRKLKIKRINQKQLQEKTLRALTETITKLGFKYDKNNLYIDRSDPEKQWASNVIVDEILAHKENDALIKKYNIIDHNNFYRMHTSNKNSVFYYDETKDYYSLEKTIDCIHEAGGLAFLAHPFVYAFDNKEDTIEEILKTTSIDGIEAEYPLFSNEEREKIKIFAKKYHKYISGGSDYHAKTKPNVEMGTGIANNLNISIDCIKDWIQIVKKI